MSPIINGSSWVKGTVIAALVLALLLACAYLGGGIFMTIYGRQFEEATPLTLIQYWLYYGEHATVRKWLYISMGAAIVITLAPFLLIFAPAKKSLFGEARFANRREIREAGLLGDNGIIIGMMGSRYLMFSGPQHAILSAPTRSGKGVSVVIPNLLNWPESVIVLDVKQENWGITSKYRAKHGQECYLFSPGSSDYKTHRYNPLAYVRDDMHLRIDDIQKIGNMLFPDKPGTDEIWTSTPRSLFMGICLFLMETPGKPFTLGQVLRETMMDDCAEHFARIIKDRKASGDPLSPVCVSSLNSYITITAETTRGGIIGGFRSRLELWMNPLIDAATSANDFDLREIRKRRMSIYIGVTPGNLVRMRPLLTLFFQQLLDLNTVELPSQNRALKHTCLLLMDEFTAIERMPNLAKGISYIAGYGIRMMPIIQSPAQLEEVYGPHDAQNFATNHALQIVFPPSRKEIKIAKDISEWLGYQTVKGRSESRSKRIFGNRVPTESVSDQKRALMLPQEIVDLGKTRELIVLENTPPIITKRVVYYKERVFIDRLRSVSASLARRRGVILEEELNQAVHNGELSAPVPKLDIERHYAMVEAGGYVRHDRYQTRNVTVDDIPNLMGLDFNIDYSRVKKPKTGEGGDIDTHALIEYADNLCRAAGLNI